jgi:microcompartment protein CcmL/EutN
MDLAVALIELTSIARGYRVADDMVKKAPIRLLDLGVISPGKYLIVVSGDVGSIEESYLAGLESGGEWVIDHLFLPQPHEGVVQALEKRLPEAGVDAMGLIETFSAISAVRSADVALKAAQVQLIELHYAKHLGGKGYFALTGEQYDVEAALEAAVSSLREGGLLLRQEIIARPHEEFKARLRGATGLGG